MSIYFFRSPRAYSLESTKKSTDPRAHMSPKPVLDAPPGVRTLDTLIKSQVLYQLKRVFILYVVLINMCLV